jgi:uncharacterized protein
MSTVKITWDEPKRQMNIAKHGVDFAEVSVDFFADALFVPAKSGRFMAIGKLDGKLTAVVFAPLGKEAVSIVSVRRASIKERKMYEKAV